MKGLMKSLKYLEKSYHEKGLTETAISKLIRQQQIAFRAGLSGNKIDGELLDLV